MDNGARAPFFPSTSNTHASWIVAISICFLIYSIVAVADKFFHRLRHVKPKAHDWTVLSALLVSFVQTVILIRACVHGLGKHQSILSESAVKTVRKEVFSSTLLAVFVHMLAKISTTLFVKAITAKREYKIASHIVLGAIAVWGVVSVLVLGFRCGSSSPWSADQDQCLDEFRVYLGINLGNIITDVALVVLPTVMMWSVQTSVDLRAQVIALFASRILVPIIIICQTAYLGNIPDNESDLTWQMVEPAILGQVALSLAILASCIPGLKGVIDVFWSGASQFVVPTVYTSSHNNSSSHGIRSFIPASLRPKNYGSRTDQKQSQLRSGNMKDSHTRSRDEGPDTRLERSESQTNLRDNNILRTMEYEVSYENATHDPFRKPGSDGISQNSTDAYADAPGHRAL